MPDQVSKEKPPGIWRTVDRLLEKTSKAAAYLAGFFILLMGFLLLKEIVFRNIGMPGSWTSEALELLIMWAFLLPMAFSQMDGAMIRVTMITGKFSPRVQVAFHIFSSLSAISFGLLLFVASYGFYAKTAGGSYFPETGLPTIVQRAGVPLCSLLLTVSAIVCTIRSILGLKHPEKFLARSSEV